MFHKKCAAPPPKNALIKTAASNAYSILDSIISNAFDRVSGSYMIQKDRLLPSLSDAPNQRVKLQRNSRTVIYSAHG